MYVFITKSVGSYGGDVYDFTRGKCMWVKSYSKRPAAMFSDGVICSKKIDGAMENKLVIYNTDGTEVVQWRN